MKELLDYIIKAIVENPKEVLIEENESDGVVNLSLKVATQDMGKVIGRQGNIIKALRNVLRILAMKEGRRVNIELVESSPQTS